MTSSNLKYSELKEEETVRSWDKMTVKYAMEHAKEIKRMIVALGKGEIQAADIDDIYMDAVYYFYMSDDYNINKAYERSSTDSIVTLEGYVHSCVRYCVIRHLHKEREHRNMMIYESNESEESELSVIDLNTKENSTDIEIDEELEDVLERYQGQRYMYGADMYLVIFIKLTAVREGKTDKQIKAIYEILNIKQKELSKFDTYDDNGPVVEIIKCVVRMDIQEAIEKISKYVYSADRIEKIIERA